MPETFPHSPQNQDSNNEVSREEVLRLRKERKETEKAEKLISLETAVKYTIVPLGLALSERDFDFESAGPDARSKMEEKIRSYYLKHLDKDIDVNTLADAIIEAPQCINDENCGIQGLLDGHERRTLMRIAEIRKDKSEQVEDEEMNPYEALFETESGEYYMARLLNMPHLEEESKFMENCVGTSDSYINRIKKGEIEILSFRQTPKFNQETKKLDVDKTVLTIEYNLKTKTIEQIKGYDDNFLTGNEDYFQDLIEALKKLKETETDKGDTRDFTEISESELDGIHVNDYFLYTEKGLVSFMDYNEKDHGFILKHGRLYITRHTPKDFAAKIFNFSNNTEIDESEISYNESEVNEGTRLYVGELFPDMARKLPEGIDHVYTIFPENRVYIMKVEIPESEGDLNSELESLSEQGIGTVNYVEEALKNVDLSNNIKTSLDLIILNRDSIDTTAIHRFKIFEKAKNMGISKEKIPLNAIFKLSSIILNNSEMNGNFYFDTEATTHDNGDLLNFYLSKDSNDTMLLPTLRNVNASITSSQYWVFSS